MSGSSVLCARAAALTICSAIVALCSAGRGQAANITNYLSDSFEWRLHSLAVNVGDTVTWVNQWRPLDGTNYVESYGGEWKSPALNSGDSFSFTFSRPGFYAYRTGLWTVARTCRKAADLKLRLQVPM